MRVRTRFYFINEDCLETTASFDSLFENIRKGKGFDETYFTFDRDGREVLIPWNSVSYVKNIDNRYDQLVEHRGEKSEVGVAADFVINLPYNWAFPQTDSAEIVWKWLSENQAYFPKEFQQIYIKIASTLLKEWKADGASEKIDKMREKKANVLGLSAYDTEMFPRDVKDLFKFLRSKMPMIERQWHEKEDKQ